jgi:hypothetical protein
MMREVREVEKDLNTWHIYTDTIRLKLLHLNLQKGRHVSPSGVIFYLEQYKSGTASYGKD